MRDATAMKSIYRPAISAASFAMYVGQLDRGNNDINVNTRAPAPPVLGPIWVHSSPVAPRNKLGQPKSQVSRGEWRKPQAITREMMTMTLQTAMKVVSLLLVPLFILHTRIRPDPREPDWRLAMCERGHFVMAHCSTDRCLQFLAVALQQRPTQWGVCAIKLSIRPGVWMGNAFDYQEMQ